MTRQESDEAPRPFRISLVRLLWLGLLAAVVVVIATNFDEVRQIAAELRSARREFLVAAAVTEVIFVANYTLFYATTFWATGLRASVWRFVFITQASHFVNLVSKTGGIGGVAFFLQEARRTGQPVARVGAAYMVAYVLGFAAFVAVLVAALILLGLQDALRRAELVAAIVIAVVMVLLGAIPIVALSSRRALGRLYHWAARPLNALARLIRSDPFVRMESVQASADELYDAVVVVRGRPVRYALPFFHALGVQGLSATLLYLMAHAVGANISIPEALSAYAISLLFSLIAITPSGLGFVEVSLSFVLVSFGVQRDTAIAATLGYRAFGFWVPVLLGAASLPVLHRIQRIEEG